MTNEQKLLILLQKAVENGWKMDNRVSNAVGWGFDVDSEFCELEYSTNCGETNYSINDVVLNFESNKINFVEALFTELIKNGGSAWYSGQFKLGFISLPTSRRLDYLFQTFNALLK
jgi:hypothetical protein